MGNTLLNRLKKLEQKTPMDYQEPLGIRSGESIELALMRYNDLHKTNLLKEEIKNWKRFDFPSIGSMLSSPSYSYDEWVKRHGPKCGDEYLGIIDILFGDSEKSNYYFKKNIAKK